MAKPVPLTLEPLGILLAWVLALTPLGPCSPPPTQREDGEDHSVLSLATLRVRHHSVPQAGSQQVGSAALKHQTGALISW